jgi:hypothetical protein
MPVDIVIHIAGPLEADKIQRCARCGFVLKDFRVPGVDMPRDEQHLGQSHLGGVIYEVGTHVEIGPYHQAIALHHDDVPLCEPVEIEHRFRIELGTREFHHANTVREDNR